MQKIYMDIDDNHVHAEVPIELINYQEDIYGHIGRVQPFVQLFQNLNLGTGIVPDTYLHLQAQKLKEWYGINSALYEEECSRLYEDRLQYFHILLDRFNSDEVFGFTSADPISAKYNPLKGVFNLLDGHHRVSFLYLMRQKFVTVKMSFSDYLEWKNTDDINPVKQAINKMNELPFPILHPAFYNYPVENDQNFFTICDRLFRQIAGIDLPGKKVTIIGNNISYLARMLKRQDAIVTASETNPDALTLGHAVNKLENTIVDIRYAEEELEKDQDIVIVLGGDGTINVDFHG
jgi:hypothetical protein